MALVLEELMDRKGLVCLNDGSPTRVGMRMPSVLDLTLVSQSLAGQIIWEVCSESCSERLEVTTIRLCVGWVAGAAM